MSIIEMSMETNAKGHKSGSFLPFTTYPRLPIFSNNPLPPTALTVHFLGQLLATSPDARAVSVDLSHLIRFISIHVRVFEMHQARMPPFRR
jgi:hypothetical protein